MKEILFIERFSKWPKTNVRNSFLILFEVVTHQELSFIFVFKISMSFCKNHIVEVDLRHVTKSFWRYLFLFYRKDRLSFCGLCNYYKFSHLWKQLPTIKEQVISSSVFYCLFLHNFWGDLPIQLINFFMCKMSFISSAILHRNFMCVYRI